MLFQRGHYRFHSNRHELHSTIVDSVVHLLVGGFFGCKGFCTKTESDPIFHFVSDTCTHAIAVHE